ncbi:uncharacterized protein GGS25DRAFT_469041 [Hypoxylon fragiforme]|uniref:uncharacterized protein n=1 Tax=Hypoxylon fragiforme TaxID=63214 RepID=UPI0020C6CDE7|nr:uncharacterized protein GGS25DRAFT_469041 [Hypoxylon fragiforme]KAI2613815.1 hypothetical protein GGS25DRAFT_469041 [Hypoxylon fragiforme]
MYIDHSGRKDAGASMVGMSVAMMSLCCMCLYPFCPHHKQSLTCLGTSLPNLGSFGLLSSVFLILMLPLRCTSFLSTYM